MTSDSLLVLLLVMSESLLFHNIWRLLVSLRLTALYWVRSSLPDTRVPCIFIRSSWLQSTRIYNAMMYEQHS